MSDPLKKDEIEDVLSSIRRLVSEDGRGNAVPEAVAPQGKAIEPQADKLVLTPSFRITEDDRLAQNIDEAVAQSVDAAASAKDEDEAGPRVVTLSSSALEFTQAAAQDHVVQEVEKLLDLTAPAPSDADSEAATAPISDLKMDRAILPAEASDAWSAAEAAANEWQSVRSSYEDMEFDPEAAGDGAYAGTEVDALDWGLTAPAATERSAQPKPTTSTAYQAQAAEQVIEADAVTHDIPEGDGTAVDEGGYEAVLDEDMLRDLVGEIVRQELQGPLGERITRNVRKLVRREINRALAARQLD